jgi:GT2 family glycosyltransferase
MDIAIIIASTNRAEEVGQLFAFLERQKKQPSMIVLSVGSAKDVPSNLPTGVEVIIGPAGLTMQRNRGLDHVLGRCDVVVFFDDDFVPAKTSLSGIERVFEDHPEIVSATGQVLSDGVKFGGISYQTALDLIRNFEDGGERTIEMDDILWAYGCNMAFRASAIGELRFDENLPLHGWQEDMDFVTRLSTRGRVVKTTAFSGVHRGVNKGRSPGQPLGFAQIVNPVYLVRKGAMSSRKAANLMVRNILINHIRAVRPESFVDRRGRVLGNWLGIYHVITGHADPTAVLRFRRNS